jgi:hypothetical protein
VITHPLTSTVFPICTRGYAADCFHYALSANSADHDRSGEFNSTSRKHIYARRTIVGGLEGVEMSDCIHCQIHDLLESHLQNPEVNVADIAFNVTEVLADLILMAPPDDQGTMIADVLRNLGHFILEKKEEAEDEGQSAGRRH